MVAYFEVQVIAKALLMPLTLSFGGTYSILKLMFTNKCSNGESKSRVRVGLNAFRI